MDRMMPSSVTLTDLLGRVGLCVCVCAASRSPFVSVRQGRLRCRLQQRESYGRKKGKRGEGGIGRNWEEKRGWLALGWRGWGVVLRTMNICM